MVDGKITSLPAKPEALAMDILRSSEVELSVCFS